jgi:hypothetical protein
VLSIDTGDLDIVEQFAATGYITDATTNPLFVSQAGMSGDPRYVEFVDEAITYAKEKMCNMDGCEVNDAIALAMDRLAVNLGKNILSLGIKGYVSTEVDPRLSFDKEESLVRARRIIQMYEDEGIPRNRSCGVAGSCPLVSHIAGPCPLVSLIQALVLHTRSSATWHILLSSCVLRQDPAPCRTRHCTHARRDSVHGIRGSMYGRGYRICSETEPGRIYTSPQQSAHQTRRDLGGHLRRRGAGEGMHHVTCVTSPSPSRHHT